MIDFVKQHKIPVAVICLLLIAATWYEFTQTSGPTPTITTTTVGGDSSASNQALVQTLLTLQAVTLSGTILSDPGFISLKDFTTQIVTEPVGRPDPFEPYSTGAVTQVSGTTNPTNPNLFAPTKKKP
jgi:hypothetical protein